jgi:hypothetical protein
VLWSAVSALLMLVLATQSVVATVSWTAPVKSGPSGGYDYGRALARTVSSTTSYLHEQYTFVNTTNPGVYYRRGNSTGSAWGTPKRMNRSGGYAEHGAIAAAGKDVYVAYEVIGSYAGFVPTDPRSIAIRVNTNHGSSTAWLGSRTLSTVARVGRPSVAATGTYGYAVYTDADSGGIVFASNTGVNAAAVGWVTRNIGLTTREAKNGNGFEGEPVVAAVGALVLVAWISQDGGRIVAKVSTDHGVTWPVGPTTLATAQVWDLSAAAASGRLGLAWAQASGIRARLHRSGAWRSTRSIATFTSTGTYRAGYGTAIALAGTGRVAIAWSACTRTDCSAGSRKGVNVRWRESTDNLSTQKPAVTIASYTAGSARRINDYPSIILTSRPRRYIVYNVANSSLSTFNLLFELGTGTP